MHLKRTRVSGLRRNLVTLLADSLDLHDGIVAHPNRKFSLRPVEEARLSDWMNEHLRLTWVVHPSPGDVERAIVDHLLPPLNSDFAHRGAYWKHTDRLRQSIHAAALERAAADMSR